VFRILLAEDNPGDVLLFREAVRSRRLVYDIVVARDGYEAISILNATNAVTRPDLIVLDVNLPKYDGTAILREVRSMESLRGVPVIMFTSSASPADRAAAEELGANLFLEKSSDLEELLKVGQVVESILCGAQVP
jgi:chemotaxis family two-component system response regulator Rcp1